MPQFAFSATDRMGNTIDGTVFAGDMVGAADQVRQMGYTPLRVEVAGRAASEPTASLAPTTSEATIERPLPVPVGVGAGTAETTQSLPQAPLEPTQPIAEWPGGSRTPLVPLGDLDTPADNGRLEPWQRGGAVPQAPPPQVTMNAYGTVVPTQALAPETAESAPTQAMAAGGVPVTTVAPEIARQYTDGRVARIPYGEGANRPKSLGQRFQENFVYPIFSGVVIKDLAPFYRQFATLINAGLSLHQSLSALEGNTKNAKLKEVARAGQRQVQAGGRFSDVMAAYPWIFSPMQVELVRASEYGGMLDKVLLQIADYIEHELEIRRMISRETLYPKIVLFFALMILGKSGMIGGPLAIVGLVLKGDGNTYFWNTLGFALLMLGPIFLTVAVFRLFLFNIEGVREGYDTFKTNIPVLGRIIKMFLLARFARTFAALYRGGFSMARALEIAGDASGNAVMRKVAYRAVALAERGQPVSEALRGSSLFPPMALDMFRTGETSGGMDTLLDKVADYNEAEAKLKSHQAALIFGVVVFLIVAILVGMAVITQYTGMANNTVHAADDIN